MDARQRAEILRVAREALHRAVRGDLALDQTAAIPEDIELPAQGGAFVSLHRRSGEIRGCVGCLASEQPLPLTIAEMASAAALRDPRFTPVKPDELAEIVVEVSVLSQAIFVDSLEEVVIGRDGLLVIGKGRRGVLLPQVALERGWDVPTFADQTCLKANLDPGSWRSGDVRLFRFAAEVITESLPPPPAAPS